MYDTHADAARIDPDHYEQSPSCGTFETAEIYGCPNAHDPEEEPAPHTDDVHLEDLPMFRETSTTLEVAQ